LELDKSGNTPKWMMMMMKFSSSPRFATTTPPQNIAPSPVLKSLAHNPERKETKDRTRRSKEKNAVQKKFGSRRSFARNGKSSGKGGEKNEG
jgi:hypothetical protein